MAAFAYRAVTAAGALRAGTLEAPSQQDALERLRQLGLTPIEATRSSAKPPKPQRPGAAGRRAAINAVGELAVLLGAGLPLDRALAIALENASHPAVKPALAAVLK